MRPILSQTKNYDLFKLHECNRDIEKLEKLKKSMKKYGFRPHKSIDVVKNGDGKLVVTDGHHRVIVASELNLPVWYTLAEDSGMTIQEEQETTIPWSIKSYLTSYTRQGISAYIAVKKYVKETNIPLGHAVSILAGESAGSGNKNKMFKAGVYRLGDQKHANDIKNIVLYMKKHNIEFATNSFFLQALSKVLRVDVFSPARFKSKIVSHKNLFEKQPNVQLYLIEIEKIYNRQSQDKIPLAFLAGEKSRERHLNFGGNKK